MYLAKKTQALVTMSTRKQPTQKLCVLCTTKKIAVFPFTECLKILSCKYNHLSVRKATVKGTELNHSRLYIFWNRYFFMDTCNWRKKQTQYAHSLHFTMHINFPESLSSCFQYHVSILRRKYAKKTCLYTNNHNFLNRKILHK